MIRIFLVRLFILLLPAAAIVGTINYKVDPANIFSTNLYVKGIAEILLAGHNVDNISNYDERLLQEQMITGLKSTPDIVVLGSSRIMQVGADFFPEKNVLNCGVSHANIKDVVAIVGLLDSMKKMPQEVLLNLDPGLICKQSTSEWESLDVYYHYFISHQLQANTGGTAANQYILKKKLASIFSFQYFQTSISFLGKGRSKKYTDVGTQIPSLYGRLHDGTVSYSYDYMHPDSALTAGKAADEGKKTGFGELDPEQARLLETLLDYFQGRHIKVHMYMLPYHPSFYKAINEFHSQQFIMYAAWFANLAARRNISITGSFNPADYKLSATAFYDDSHCDKEKIKKIFIQ